MKIGYLIPEFPGQTHIFFWREMRALRRLGVDVEVASTRRPPEQIVCHDWAQDAMRETTYLVPMSFRALLGAIRTLLAAGPGRWWRCLAAVVTVPDATVPERLRMLALLLPASRLVRLARRRRWSHLHAHSCGHSALLASLAHLLADQPYSLTLHGSLSTYGPAQGLKWRLARFGITVTRRLRDEVTAAVNDLPEDRIDVAPMGVDLSVFRRKTPYPPQPETPARIVSCGRLHEHKGHQDVIRAVAELIRQGLAVHLVVLGEGEARQSLEKLVTDLGLTSAVDLPGAVSEQRVRDELERAHVFALGSHDEAIGVATMEAMAMGLPVVVTDVGGVRELIRDQVHGYLVPPRDPSAMAAAMRRVLAAPDFARRVGEAGWQRVCRHFGSDISASVIAHRLGLVSASRHVPMRAL